MKQLILISKTMLLVALVSLTAISYAGVKPYGEVTKGLRSQIEKLIDNPNLSNTGLQKEEALLHFFVNDKNEVVVLLVETENSFVDQFLKERLNYKKLKEVTGGRYTLKITIKNGSS